MRRTPRGSLTLGLGFAFAAALAAGGARAGDPSRDLGDAPSAESRDLDEAATAEPKEIEDVRGGVSQPDEVEAGDLDAARSHRAEDVNQNLGSTQSLEEADRSPEWEPPACETLDVSLGSLPAGADTAGWSSLLAEAQSKIGASLARLGAADADYTYARNRQKPRGAALQSIIKERDEARVEYAKARCRLPELVEAARRAGVSAEVWRQYPASMP
jgi:hypothetical protein